MKHRIKLLFNISSFDKNFILPSCFLSLAIILLYNPLTNIGVKSFDRSLGNGVLYGIDITKRISNISFYDFVLIPVTFLGVYLGILALCKNMVKDNDECIEFINIVSIISFAPLIFTYINRFSSKSFLGMEVIFPCFIIAFAIMFLFVNHRVLKLDFALFKWCIFAVIPITLLLALLFYKFNVNISIYILSIVYAVAFIVLFSIITICYRRIDFFALKKSYLIVMIAPIIISLFLELTNILNQYSIFLSSKVIVTIIIYLLLAITFIAYYLFLKSRQNSCENFCFEKYYYPILLIGLALVSVQLPLQATFKTEFFEQSNSGTAISELFNFGKIPIIETFDAHMLQNEIGNILYGLLNNDSKGALFTGYSLLPIFIVLYYFLFTRFFNKDISFFIMLLYPITADNTFQLFSLAPIVILSFLYAYKNRTYKGYMFYWISISISCLFKLDMGFALAFASISTWAIMWLMKKNQINIKKLILSCLYIVSIYFVLFISICLVKRVPPLQRIMEFLNLCKSNINWGYNTLGNPIMVAFMMSYFIIPAITFILIIAFIFKKYKDKEFISDNKFIIGLTIGLLCIFNLSRGIVRHSLVENTNIHAVSSSTIFISLFIYIFSKKNKLIKFIISNVTLIIVFGLTVNLNSTFPRPLINSALSRYLTFDSYKTVSVEKTERVIVSDEMKKVYLPLKNILDKTLLSNETYIDFTNQTFLYSLTEREKPMYLNQSPGLLSGEYTQQKFIEQCEKNPEKVPFVLMPIEQMPLSTSLDEIQNSYRYYLVSEYISNNFKPLFRTSKFALWCRNDRFYEKANLVSKLMINNKDSYSKVSLSEESTNMLIGYNENLSVSNNQLILKSTNVDPILIGLDKLMKLKEISSDVSAINISIEYDSDKEGLFELFYTTDNGENFNSQKVVSKNLSKSGVFEATIPYTKDTAIRFDIPENSTVKIKNISFKGIKDLYSDDIKTIDYNYMPIDYHSYHLMNIPYIWANYDKIGVDRKEEQLKINKNSSVYNFSSIDKQLGNYLFVNATSAKDGIMTVQLGKEDGSGFVMLSQFDFSLKSGNNQSYLIRLSSDFMWYSNQINAIKITSDNNATLNKTSIMKGDTLK